MRHLFYVSQLYSLSILRPIQAAARNRGDECAWFFDPPLDGTRFLESNELHLKSVVEVLAWVPDAVYVPGNIVPDFFPGVKVQVFHGLATDETGKKGHYRIRGFFDLYCTRNPDETEKFEELARKHGHFRVAETGWPKLDPLFSIEGRDIRSEIGTDKPIVLFASTFSPSLTSAPVLVDTIRALSAAGEWHWLVTLHPKMPTDVVARYRAMAGPHLTFFESHEDVLPLLRVAEAMLCDTSSIAIEFQMLGKPLVTFRNKSPGPQMIDVTHPEEIGPAIEKALARPAGLMDATLTFIDTVQPVRDGQSSERILAEVDRIISSGYGHLKPKPLNLLRKWKIRKKLGYFKF